MEYPSDDYKIIQGDCLEVMKGMADKSVDLVLTDPPYELGFMGKTWDSTGIANNVELWKECLRVLKPGGHLLAFSGTRTYHRMACAIEDAGFEVRDMIEWVYGSGFPKSLNICKAVDKLQGNEREETDYIAPDGKKRWGGNSFSVGEAPDGRGINKQTKGTSEWEGWGTALKPAHEPICMARKPLAEKTVAENCLKWGTGGINIDESRVETSDDLSLRYKSSFQEGNSQFVSETATGSGKRMELEEPDGTKLGRFPANLIHDNSEEVRECFPETKSGTIKPYKHANRNNTCYGEQPKYVTFDKEGDSGNASRFFKSIIYQAKASKSDRGKDNKHPTVKPTALMEYLIKMASKEGDLILDPFAGSCTTLLACKQLKRRCICIEKEADYIRICNERLERSTNSLF